MNHFSSMQQSTMKNRVYKATMIYNQQHQVVVQLQKKVTMLEDKSSKSNSSVKSSLLLCNALDELQAEKSKCDHMYRFISKSR